MLGGNTERAVLLHYFKVGLSAMWIVNSVLDSLGMKPRRILDMPCGHGRVLRFLKAGFPSAELYACDLLRDGVDFCSGTFRVRGIYSNPDFGKVVFPSGVRFDLIWVGSLVTHLPESRTKDFLRFCERNLSATGVAIVTSSGQHCYEQQRDRIRQERSELTGAAEGFASRLAPRETFLKNYERHGYGYLPSPKQEDYGGSLIKLEWFHTVAPELGLKVVATAEKAWDDRQDVVVLRRRKKKGKGKKGKK